MKIAAIFLLGLLICLTAVFVWLGGPWSMSQARHFRKAVSSGNHLEIARAAVATIRKCGTNELLLYNGHRLTNLPLVISALQPSKVWVRPDCMTIEFHGGFDHFGFEIREREAVWEMTRYTEQGHRPILTIAKEERTSEQDGAANGFLPIRSESNRTSSAAGSYR